MDILKVPQLRRTRHSTLGSHRGLLLLAVLVVGVISSLAVVGVVKSRRSIEAQVNDREAEAQPALFLDPSEIQQETQ